MADSDTRPRKHQKFLFDVNNFDDPDPVDPDLPPPPPTFSEAELAGAKASEHERGRQAGHTAEKAARETIVAGLIKTIADHFTKLFDAEKQRADQFEGEVLLLTKTIFDKLFPALNEAHGLNEVETMIATVLETQRNQREIIVEVHSEFAPDIQSLADHLMKSMHAAGTVTVRANDSLARGDCKMSWNDGGAERSATHLSSEIARGLDEILGKRPRLQDNRNADTVQQGE
jgi:flagellar assembly protein FliH